MISHIKNGIHVVGIDDAPHQRGDSITEIFFTFCRSKFLESVTHSTIQVDGLDSTQVILEELQHNANKFSLILLHGITLAGLNIVDITKISRELNKPILAMTENLIHGNSIQDAISQLPNFEERKLLIQKAGPLYYYKTHIGDIPISYHKNGIDETLAIKFFKKFCIRSRLPEQLLLAHKIATAWKK